MKEAYNSYAHWFKNDKVVTLSLWREKQGRTLGSMPPQLGIPTGKVINNPEFST